MLIEWSDQVSDLSDSVAINRAAKFGDGFFTTGVIENGELNLREYHLRRIKESAEKLMFKNLAFDRVEASIDKACIRQANAIIRIDITRQQYQRGYSINPSAENKLLISLHPLVKPSHESYQLIDSDIAVSVNPNLAGIKHLNRLDSVLAASQLQTPQTEALMYHQEQVICGSKSNLFFCLDGVWHTPSLELAGVAGVMRQRVLDAMDRFDVNYKISLMTRSQLARVQLAFVTNCLIGVRPVCQINQMPIATDGVLKLKRQLSL
jgi:4-amino-4-deoxychorismate lyase